MTINNPYLDKLIRNLDNHIYNNTLTSEIIYDMFSEYRLDSIKNDMPDSAVIYKVFNEYERDIIYHTYNWKSNTKEFNEWFHTVLYGCNLPEDISLYEELAWNYPVFRLVCLPLFIFSAVYTISKFIIYFIMWIIL